MCQHARLGVYAPQQRGGKLLACSRFGNHRARARLDSLLNFSDGNVDLELLCPVTQCQTLALRNPNVTKFLVQPASRCVPESEHDGLESGLWSPPR